MKSELLNLEIQQKEDGMFPEIYPGNIENPMNVFCNIPSSWHLDLDLNPAFRFALYALWSAVFFLHRGNVGKQLFGR